MKSKTLDNSTYATVPGMAKASRVKVCRYQCPGSVEFGLRLVASFVPFCLRIFVPPLAERIHRWAYYRDLLSLGDCVAARVIETDNGTLAVYTDLDMTLKRPAPVVKIIPAALPQQVRHLFRAGEKVAAVATYRRDQTSDEIGYWCDFSPIPAFLLASGQSDVDSIMQRIPHYCWDALDKGLQSLVPDIAPGLHFVNLPSGTLPKGYDPAG